MYLDQAPSAVLLVHKKKSTKIFVRSDCLVHSDLCVHPLPLSGHFEAPGWPRLFPLITEQVERRWGESCRAAASFPLLQKPSNNGAAGRILLLFFFSAPGWSIWEFHTMPLTRRVAVRLACSACELRTGRSVPPTVNQRVPSVRAARSRATFHPSIALPSIDVPPPHRLLLHFHLSANPPIPLQPKQKQIIDYIYIYISNVETTDCRRLNTILRTDCWRNPPCGNLIKVASYFRDCHSTLWTLLHPVSDWILMTRRKIT